LEHGTNLSSSGEEVSEAREGAAGEGVTVEGTIGVTASATVISTDICKLEV
jgi:hypothetical protein